jgi:hypothetical protein
LLILALRKKPLGKILCRGPVNFLLQIRECLTFAASVGVPAPSESNVLPCSHDLPKYGYNLAADPLILFLTHAL